MHLLEAAPGTEVTVNLEHRTVTAGDLAFGFEIDDYTRWRLMEGLDDIGLTLRDEQAITDFETTRPGWMPLTLPVRHA
jgi:3-isopropylmalate/(R)-2-methylmalate dehydratase small subunit